MLYTSFLKLSTESKDKHWNNINQKKKKKKGERFLHYLFILFNLLYKIFFFYSAYSSWRVLKYLFVANNSVLFMDIEQPRVLTNNLNHLRGYAAIFCLK